jgi:valyl-tRNA synthetase
MPFVTEEVWQHLYADLPADERPAPALIIAPWPAAAPDRVDTAAEDDFGLLREIVTRIRDAKKEAGVEPGKRVQAIVAAGAKAPMLKQQATVIEQLARTEPPRVERKLAAKPEQAMALVAGGVEVYLPLAGLLDLAKEIARLDSEIDSAHRQIERSERMLGNDQFVGRAKPEVVQKERDALAAARAALAKLEARRAELADGQVRQ